jgi:hypothetical protein
MLARAPACALALLLAGCFVDAGLPDTGSTPSTAATSAGSTDAPATTSTTDVATTTAPEATSTSSTTDATTMPAACGVAGDQCDGAGTCCGCLSCTNGVCIATADPCGPCLTCAPSGMCELADPGTACQGPSAECEDTIWGVEGDGCFAYAYATGECNASGTCIASGCGGKGDSIESCDSAACVDPSTCVADNSANTLGQFCVEQGQTPDCTTTCLDTASLSVLSIRECGLGGECKTLVSDCGPYKCAGPTQCKTFCEFDEDCLPLHICDGGVCVL